jgi:ubiquinone/menaquinone biosynthesis C-methylase UbiE
MTERGSGPVERFYDHHPINEEQILEALRARGVAARDITADALHEHDQDHYGGVAALETLATKAGIESRHYVVDLCSGMGGPARYLARTRGCRVVGIDLTASRHQGAVRLTRLVKLGHRVSFCRADVRDIPFPDNSFDVALSQEAFAHIPDKPRLVAEAVRVLKPGGTLAFTDIVRRGALPEEIEERLADGMAFAEIESAEGYASLLHANGCVLRAQEDLSEDWTRILRRRLEMYRGLRGTTIAQFGEVHYEKYDAAYAFFVSLYGEGLLGGARVVARKAPG